MEESSVNLIASVMKCLQILNIFKIFCRDTMNVIISELCQLDGSPKSQFMHTCLKHNILEYKRQSTHTMKLELNGLFTDATNTTNSFYQYHSLEKKCSSCFVGQYNL